MGLTALRPGASLSCEAQVNGEVDGQDPTLKQARKLVAKLQELCSSRLEEVGRPPCRASGAAFHSVLSCWIVV